MGGKNGIMCVTPKVVHLHLSVVITTEVDHLIVTTSPTAQELQPTGVIRG